MNEYQGALNTIKKTICDLAPKGRKNVFALRSEIDAMQELVDCATPKKPILANGNKCSNCCTLMQWEYPRCPFCGQAIDWSD